MIPAAYLDADAARLGDAELPRTVPVPLRTVTDTVLQEIDYAVDLFRRADSAVSGEVAILRALVPGIDWFAVHDASRTLLQAALGLHVYALQARAARTV